MSEGNSGIRAEVMSLKLLSRTIVGAAMFVVRSMIVSAGCVVVLTFVVFGLHVNVPALQTPPTAPQSAACVNTVQTPPAFAPVNTPSGPRGEAQVLVTYANPPLI